MAEEHQDKFSLPLAGVVALVAMAGAVIFYQTPLKTSRPIDQEAEKKAASHTRVQSRLWQDPFEAVETHRSKERERNKTEKSEQKQSEAMPSEDAPFKGSPFKDPPFKELIERIKEAGASANFRIIPVFVDGSPYASGMESRLKDRYAVVSALGAADYMPESGEYIRYFVWKQQETDSKTEHEIIIPVERFMPKAKIRVPKPEDVLVLWLKDQDFSESRPLQLMNKLIGELKRDVPLIGPEYFRSIYLELFGPATEDPSGDIQSCDYKIQPKSILNQNLTISSGLNDTFDRYCFSTRVGIPENRSYYTLLGPRYSGTITAMVKELSGYEKECGGGSYRNGFLHNDSQDFSDLKGVTFYSYWPTVNDNFVLDCLPIGSLNREGSVERLFKREGIEFIRTISSDALLAEQLVKELKRRQVKILSEEGDVETECKPTIVLISEWDTIYGRTLPRIFVAVAKNMERNGGNLNLGNLDVDINTLRRDEWPERIVRYSYLAGLDGELPPKQDSDETGKTKDKKNADNKDPAIRRAMEEAAEGRDQLDYLQRMVVDLKAMEDSFNEASKNCKDKPKSPMTELAERKKGFKAIGVLGNDVYDKLLILQALKKEFPQSIFFTIDMDARLLQSKDRKWTRNLIVASNFGLQLHPELQQHIPPFRDNSQTALFYSVLRALKHLNVIGDVFENPKHLELASANCSIPSIANPTGMSKWPGCFSEEIKPKVYEIGRSAAIDITVEPESLERRFKNIHVGRPDLDEGKIRFPAKVETIIWVSLAFFVFGIGAMLISHETEKVFRTSLFWTSALVVFTIGTVVVFAAMRDGAEGELFVLTQGVSIWPTVAIQLIAGFLCVGFYFWTRYILHSNDDKLSRQFGLKWPEAHDSLEERLRRVWRWLFGPVSNIVSKIFDYFAPIPRWRKPKEEVCLSKNVSFVRPQAPRLLRNWTQQWQHPKTTHQIEDAIDITDLWEEYRERRDKKNTRRRILPQFLVFSVLLSLLYWKVGFPPAPCRGGTCFFIYHTVTILSSLSMILFMLYVIDVTRLCRRFINILCEKKFPWSDSVQIINEFHYPPIDREYLQRLLCVDLIGKWTAVVSKLLYFPFIILFLLVAARHPYIDNFDWPMWLAIIYGLIAAYAIGIVIALRATAEKAKRGAIEQLEEKLNAESSGWFSLSLGREEQKRRIEEVIEKIKNNHEGAFLPFYKYPILGALAVPAGGTGLLYLIDYLVQSF